MVKFYVGTGIGESVEGALYLGKTDEDGKVYCKVNRKFISEHELTEIKQNYEDNGLVATDGRAVLLLIAITTLFGGLIGLGIGLLF